MIQASHDPEPAACLKVLDSFLRAGAHYLTNAEWGCEAGVHTAWITVQAENESEARLMVPPVIRNSALLVKLNKFTPEEIAKLHQEIHV
jgi:hypothetical protein